MNPENARKIILNAVETSEPLWSKWEVEWKEIDDVFIKRGYERLGFNGGMFAENLEANGIFSIEKLGMILDNYNRKEKHDSENVNSLEPTFYKELSKGLYGDEGKNFYISVRDYKGPGFKWQLSWQLLVCCNYLKNSYNSRFSYYLKKKFADFSNKSNVSDNDLFGISLETWEDFKKTEPWADLYGIGINTFDYLIGDIKDFDFNKNSFDFDTPNAKFLIITGIFEKEGLDRKKAIELIQRLDLRPYTLRQINKGIYAYCSKTESKTYGYCLNPIKCEDCQVNDICEKNF